MKDKKKLTLHKETLRNLNEEEIGRVAGGDTIHLCHHESYIDFPGTICPQPICVPAPTENC